MPKQWWVAAAGVLLSSACSVGEGEGEFTGELHVESCGIDGEFVLSPNFFSAEAYEERLDIVIQEGSDLQIRSDGLFLYIDDANRIQEELLGQALSLEHDPGTDEPPLLEVVMYLNDSCPIERRQDPVSLQATTGSVTFESIYAPDGEEDSVETSATMSNVRFTNLAEETEWGLLSGYFRFIYARGRPAQRYP